MKVGILTFHNAYNYGAVLQAYATQTFIKGLGHEAEIIDYHNRSIDEHYEQLQFRFSTLPKKKFYRIPEYCLGKFYYWKKRKAYKAFKKRYLTISKQSFLQSNYVCFHGYDLILIGSDQLWNPQLTGGFDHIYWGDFMMMPQKRIASLAVSMNTTHVDGERLLFIQEHLKNFQQISVREDTLKTLLTPLANQKVIQLSDPVFYLAPEKWISLCSPIRKKNFIVVYALNHQEETIAVARKLGERERKEVIIIHPLSDRFPHRGYKESLGPLEFLSYIYAADGVVTSSFHGTAFSLIFCKRFICVEPEGTHNIRIRSLLNAFNQVNHILSPKKGKQYAFQTAPKRNDIYTIIKKVQEDTLSFISKALSPQDDIKNRD